MNQWIFAQGGMVVILVLVIIGFFRFVIPMYTRQQERNEEVLRTTIQDHKERADRQHVVFTETIKEVAASHERAIEKVIKAFERKS